ncbi:MAG: nucleotidyltransferase family protein [Clostridiales bacterium]|nr:nucleotidyltransferase family protein [Clostridiales bacterium]MDO4350508.1 nucleotidyltransferase family protein [Eubacteriales bacterium]MDY4009037.1 nucleotidyltransferase family protein [Candidatus Limiplasma sp.]
MKPVVGVICEYDPFHLGHRRHFELIRAALPGARIVCLMSGCFTQRGMPALHAPRARAQAALNAGADLVLELPCAFSVRDAERFALGGVHILSSLGFVTHLSFGAEDALDRLRPAAALLEQPTPAFERALKAALAQGASFAAAQGAALDSCLGAPGLAEAPAWQRPNNILALCYLRAMNRLQSPLQPLPVKREGDYHAQTLADGAFPSATAVRAAFAHGAFAQADAACGYALPREPVCRPDALDGVLLYKLRAMSAQALAALPDCTEGLENRLKACALRCASREALLDALKTRRYARARLSRLCCHALLDVTAELLNAHPAPEYVRLLGLRRAAPELTGLLGQSPLPVIAKAADGDTASPLWQLDLRAYDLWALGAGLPAGLMLTQGVAAL